MDEFEYKRLLTGKQYRFLVSWAQSDYVIQQVLLVNYYYDTPSMDLNSQGITIRFCQIGEKLKGTIKRHQMNGNGMQSNEESFRVDQLPRTIEYNNKQLSLQGQLVTERIAIPFDKQIELFLDCDYYLGLIDYEFDLEFIYEKQETADLLMKDIDLFMQEIDHPLKNAIYTTKRSKSEKFFSALQKQ